MKRVKTLVGGILGVVGVSIFTAVYLFGLLLIFDILFSSGASANEGIIILTLLIAIFNIVTIILNACSISAWSKDKERYSKKKGLIITTIIFNFIVSFYDLYSLITAEESGLTVMLIYIIAIAFTLVANILFIIDLAQEKKRVSTQAIQEEKIAQ
ncbi:MAG: hypothetical protein IJX25_01590 [Clostridia bacterium]|nr:hypothetical protein [Clostridia bacterium]